MPEVPRDHAMNLAALAEGDLARAERDGSDEAEIDVARARATLALTYAVLALVDDGRRHHRDLIQAIGHLR